MLRPPSMASPKIGSLLNLLMSSLHFLHPRESHANAGCGRTRRRRLPPRYISALHDLFQKSGRLMPSFSVSKTRASNPKGWGSLAVGVDAGQQIEAAQQVRRIDGPFLDLLTFFIGRADDAAALESAAGDQHGEDGPKVMATAVPRRLPGHLRRSAELAGAPNQGAIEQALLAQIRKQRCQSLVQPGTLSSSSSRSGFRAYPSHRGS